MSTTIITTMSEDLQDPVVIITDKTLIIIITITTAMMVITDDRLTLIDQEHTGQDRLRIKCSTQVTTWSINNNSNSSRLMASEISKALWE